MAKLVRKTQKIFASGSAQNQVTSFGSIKAGAVDYTKDVADIQTEAFEGGWSSAVQDDYAPYRQDRNAVDFVTTSQLAYVFQEGLPEYDAGTTYYKGSWVKGNDGDAFSIYESLSDDNIGNALSDEEKWEKKSFGGGLEIGDIGIAPFGIDEAQNKRRYLNGQVISQAQFVSFTNKLKSIIQTYPSIATSETNWQATVTNSKLGQCGKFVIDDNAGTIRLPKVVNINGLQDLSLLGGIKAESLPNIKGTVSGVRNDGNTSGAFTYLRDNDYTGHPAAKGKEGISFDASRSSSTYQDNAPVQQEAIQYPYFIQVATGVEESVDVTREIELNNPFSLLDYKWSEYEITNASWLLSNGQFNSGATYISVYNLLLEIYNGTETKDGVSVKLSTEAYTDTDFVINTADTTFRLPIKVKLASGNAVVGNGMTLGLTDGTDNRGLLSYNGDTYTRVALGAAPEYYGVNVGTTTTRGNAYDSTTYGITTDPTKSGIETSSSGLKLYFYVGETIQDANVIAASQVLTKVANSIDRTSATDRATVVGWGMPDYSAGVDIASTLLNSPSYTAPYDCYIHFSTYGNVGIRFKIGNNYVIYLDGDTGVFVSDSIYLEKGETLIKDSFQSGAMAILFPLKGVN